MEDFIKYVETGEDKVEVYNLLKFVLPQHDFERKNLIKKTTIKFPKQSQTKCGQSAIQSKSKWNTKSFSVESIRAEINTTTLAQTWVSFTHLECGFQLNPNVITLFRQLIETSVAVEIIKI